MSNLKNFISVPIFIIVLILISTACEAKIKMSSGEKKMISLPKPNHKGKMSVEEAIYRRISTRHFKNISLTLQEVSQLLWAANGICVDGITGPSRSFPSAGGLYPLDVYFIALNVENLIKGLYRYHPDKNKLELIIPDDLKSKILKSAYNQSAFKTAAGVLVYAYDYDKMERHYGQRGTIRYAPMDIGHSAENVYLQAEALGIGTVAIGAFDDKKIEKLLKIKGKKVIYLLPVGKK